jgi:putative transcriptional regulator
MQSTNLTHQFLIAMPTLADPNFYHTVTYICAHNEEGAMGIIINRPLGLVLSEVLEQMQMTARNEQIAQTPIYQGGPVHTDRGFVLHQPIQKWDYSIQIGNAIGITTSRDILLAIADGKGPEHSLIALGYAGWGAGQLEQEIRENAWLNVPADTGIIFKTPVERRWEAAAALAGIDLDKLSSHFGHA